MILREWKDEAKNNIKELLWRLSSDKYFYIHNK